MSIKIKKPGKGISKQELSDFEVFIGHRLPADYREFLIKHNGGITQTNEFDVPQINSGSGINEFLSVKEMVQQKKRLGKRIVENAWPIAYAEGGNLVCIVLGDNSGIYFWDHELEAEEHNLPSWKNMFLLATSFNQFWQSLRKFDPSKVVLKPGQVQSVWVDPSLLESNK